MFGSRTVYFHQTIKFVNFFSYYLTGDENDHTAGINFNPTPSLYADLIIIFLLPVRPNLSEAFSPYNI